MGKKYSCPGCHSKLKFTRPPTSQMLKCPNCRRKLRIQAYEAAAGHDELVKQAIQSLVKWNAPEDQPYDYRRDPGLDDFDDSQQGIWKFNQPWPEHTGEVVYENAEVLCNPNDITGAVHFRRMLRDNKFRRVTIYRTGEVEQMEVTGHWWDHEPHEGRIGLLPRVVVRQLNRLITARGFAARINTLKLVNRDGQDLVEVYIDIAVDLSAKRKHQSGIRYR
jgi:hypothetical protein